MGYRDTWINHAGLASRHYEVVLHAFDREIPNKPLRMLIVGVENGGCVEVWQQCAPEGSTVLGMDIDIRCSDLPIPVSYCDITDRAWLDSELDGQMFDVIIDSTNTMSANLWPYLEAGGLYFYESYIPGWVQTLVSDLALDRDSWLPIEEVMRVSTYSHICVIEKRNPKVVPYLEVLVGNFADVVTEDVLRAQGVKRVIVA